MMGDIRRIAAGLFHVLEEHSMDEKRCLVRWGKGEHSSTLLTKAQAEETAAWIRRLGCPVEIIEETTATPLIPTS
jgi:hypothetical protein